MLGWRFAPLSSSVMTFLTALLPTVGRKLDLWVHIAVKAPMFLEALLPRRNNPCRAVPLPFRRGQLRSICVTVSIRRYWTSMRPHLLQTCTMRTFLGNFPTTSAFAVHHRQPQTNDIRETFPRTPRASDKCTTALRSTTRTRRRCNSLAIRTIVNPYDDHGRLVGSCWSSTPRRLSRMSL